MYCVLNQYLDIRALNSYSKHELTFVAFTSIVSLKYARNHLFLLYKKERKCCTALCAQPVAFNANSRALLSNCRQENFADKQSNFGAHACANAKLKLLLLHELSLAAAPRRTAPPPRLIHYHWSQLHLQKQENVWNSCKSKTHNLITKANTNALCLAIQCVIVLIFGI